MSLKLPVIFDTAVADGHAAPIDGNIRCLIGQGTEATGGFQLIVDDDGVGDGGVAAGLCIAGTRACAVFGNGDVVQVDEAASRVENRSAVAAGFIAGNRGVGEPQNASRVPYGAAIAQNRVALE